MLQVFKFMLSGRDKNIDIEIKKKRKIVYRRWSYKIISEDFRLFGVQIIAVLWGHMVSILHCLFLSLVQVL